MVMRSARQALRRARLALFLTLLLLSSAAPSLFLPLPRAAALPNTLALEQAEGNIIVRVRFRETYTDIEDAVKSHGEANLIDVSRCTAECTRKQVCGCPRCTLRNCVGLDTEELPCPRLYALDLCIVFPVLTKASAINLLRVLMERGRVQQVYSDPPCDAVHAYINERILNPSSAQLAE